jgi:hypothetical protein
MKKTFLLMFAFFAFSLQASSITVKLAADANGTLINENLTQIEISPDESLKLRLEVREGKTSSGALTISREVSENTYELVGNPHFSYAGCGCKGTPEMPDLNEEYTFVPLTPGKYRIEALYGGISKKIDVVVKETTPVTTASTTTTSTTASTTATTTTTTSTTAVRSIATTATPQEQTPTTTLEKQEVSSTTVTTAEKEEKQDNGLPSAILLPLIAFALVVLLLVGKNLMGSK